MSATNSENKNYLFYKLNGKADKDTIPAFWQVEKKGESWVKTVSFDTVVGELTRAEIKEFTYENQLKKSFSLEFADAGEVMIISMSHCLLAYNIINCLLNVEKGQQIKIKVYRKHVKETNKYFASSYITDIMDKKIPWLINSEEAPRPVPVKVNGVDFFKDGKQVFDDKEVKQFWENKFKLIIKKLEDDNNFPTMPAAPMEDFIKEDLPF